jgi:hypothetical protein
LKERRFHRRGPIKNRPSPSAPPCDQPNRRMGTADRSTQHTTAGAIVGSQHSAVHLGRGPTPASRQTSWQRGVDRSCGSDPAGSSLEPGHSPSHRLGTPASEAGRVNAAFWAPRRKLKNSRQRMPPRPRTVKRSRVQPVGTAPSKGASNRDIASAFNPWAPDGSAVTLPRIGAEALRVMADSSAPPTKKSKKSIRIGNGRPRPHEKEIVKA